MLYGDYYALTPFHHSAAQWVARQFHSPETGQGLVQGIRLPVAPEATLTVPLHSLRPEATYLFEEAETGETRTLTGAALAQAGFMFAVPPRAGSLWFYRPAAGA
jgi:hypothetical protein